MKEYWKTMVSLQNRMKRKIIEIRTLHQKAEGMNGSGMNDMPKTTSPDHSKMENCVFRIMALEDDIRAIQNEYDRLLNIMEQRIAKVKDSDARDVLTKRYLEFKPWDTIASEMFLSERQTYYIHKKALELLS